MATGGEPRYACADCGISGPDRDPNERNNLFQVQGPTGTHWLNRCRACYVKHLEEQQ